MARGKQVNSSLPLVSQSFVSISFVFCLCLHCLLTCLCRISLFELLDVLFDLSLGIPRRLSCNCSHSAPSLLAISIRLKSRVQIMMQYRIILLLAVCTGIIEAGPIRHHGALTK